MLHRQRGGCNMGFGLRSTTATFVYMPHSAVVIRFEKALPLRTREKGGRRERPTPPPPNRGVMRPATDGVCTRLCTGPHGVAHVLIYPCGKAWKNPLSPRASSCRIGPRRQGFASPLRALDGSGPIRKTRCLRGERGGSGRGARGRVASPLAHDKGYYHSCFGRDAESQLSAIQDS